LLDWLNVKRDARMFLKRVLAYLVRNVLAAIPTDKDFHVSLLARIALLTPLGQTSQRGS
jgi:hypothetical protein